MPRLILHTGLHKTGTTSLQKAFYDNRRWLRSAGVLYPTTGLSKKPVNWGHHELAYAMRQEQTAQSTWSDLRKEADKSGLETIFVSSEELSLLPFPRLPGIRPYQIIAECFTGYDITLLVYLRPQADLVASLYNHHVKSVGETAEVIDFLARVAPRLDYAQYLHVAAVAWGNEAIAVRRYGPPWMPDDILDDVAAQIGLTLDHSFSRPDLPMNPGLTQEGLEAMLMANARFPDAPDKLRRERNRIVTAHQAPAYHSHDMLDAQTRRVIEAMCRYKNIQIARRYLKLNSDLFVRESLD